MLTGGKPDSKRDVGKNLKSVFTAACSFLLLICLTVGLFCWVLVVAVGAGDETQGLAHARPYPR
jgi:peptidoglycan biosynthesis protein MviN/MurJ (putative lipid II flippase)